MANLVPVAITCRGVRKTHNIESWVDRLVHSKLEPVCDHIKRCDVAIEEPNEHPRRGSGFRVRLKVTVPPSHEVVVSREPHEGDIHDGLYTVMQRAFAAARRKLKRLNERQKQMVKSHPRQQPEAVIRSLHTTGGLLVTRNGREIEFHHNAVVGIPHSQLRPGMTVNFEAARDGAAAGPRAATVRVIDRRGARIRW
jgi:hypothetical protein